MIFKDVFTMRNINRNTCDHSLHGNESLENTNYFPILSTVTFIQNILQFIQLNWTIYALCNKVHSGQCSSTTGNRLNMRKKKKIKIKSIMTT